MSYSSSNQPKTQSNDQIEPVETNLNPIEITTSNNTNTNSQRLNQNSKLDENYPNENQTSSSYEEAKLTEILQDDDCTCSKSSKLNSDESFQLSQTQEDIIKLNLTQYGDPTTTFEQNRVLSSSSIDQKK